jgi:hypothetical protein
MFPAENASTQKANRLRAINKAWAEILSRKDLDDAVAAC